jgi:hypothetical protein
VFFVCLFVSLCNLFFLDSLAVHCSLLHLFIPISLISFSSFLGG